MAYDREIYATYLCDHGFSEKSLCSSGEMKYFRGTVEINKSQIFSICPAHQWTGYEKSNVHAEILREEYEALKVLNELCMAYIKVMYAIHNSLNGDRFWKVPEQ